MPKCGRIHLGPAKRVNFEVVCGCCNKALTKAETVAYLKIRFRVYEITQLALLSTPSPLVRK